MNEFTVQGSSTLDEVQKYTYTPLKEGQIRLLHLELNDRVDDAIVGRLKTVSLSTSSTSESVSCKNQYTALSYAWGRTYEDGSHLTDFVICDGWKLRVTPNLKQALRRIRQAATAVTPRDWTYGDGHFHKMNILWVDAICINQDDLQERASQVQMMGQIFTECKNLFVWLGEPDDGDLGIAQQQLLFPKAPDKQLRSDRHSGSQRLSFRRLRSWKKTKSERRADIDTSPKLQQQVEIPIRSVLESILARPWFTRRWVIQEAAPEDPDGFIMLGETIWSRHSFTSMLDENSLLDAAKPLQKRDIRCSIVHTLYAYDESECEDPRDRIFALRNLSIHANRIRVDYNRDVRDTYLDLARAVVFGIIDVDDFAIHFSRGQAPMQWVRDEGEALAMFAMASCKKRAGQRADAGIEAWVPDWSSKTNYDSPEHRWAVKRCVMDSRKPFAGNETSLLVSRNGYHYCKIVGLVMDVHGQLGGNLMPATESQHHYANLNEWVKSTYELALSYFPNSAHTSFRMWLPMQLFRDGKTVVFTLHPGQAQQTFQNFPIYRLESCFTADAPSVEECVELASPSMWEKLRDSETLLSVQTFCLE